MRLGNLLGPEIDAPPAAGGVEITGLTADSRAVKPGMVFAALAGSRSDGSRFIELFEHRSEQVELFRPTEATEPAIHDRDEAVGPARCAGERPSEAPPPGPRP